MSAQFGRWHFEGREIPEDHFEQVTSILAPYGPDSSERYSDVGIKILYRAFHTTRESRRETQPYMSASTAVITWDGRLDNRAELLSEMRQVVTIDSSDIEIVAAAYDKWGLTCFARLIGDWALSVWNPRERVLVLARDPIGTRHLYYSFENNQVTWSTILDPLVLLAGKTFRLCEEYIAGWFAFLPAAHLTPYVGIDAVPPSSFVLFRPGRRTISKYWDFDPNKKIRYHSDAEYEEHFRTVFATAVRRRLRSDRPILAELSGGMDSSSIVCMADSIIARGDAQTPRLDTISWYDDSAPDERDYFTKVEQKRGRIGYRLEMDTTTHTKRHGVDSKKGSCFGLENEGQVTTQGLDRTWPDTSDEFIACLRSHGYRVTLSGIGGELPTGGFVPTPTPELQDLLMQLRLVTLARQLGAWAKKMRKPQLPLLREAIRGFFTRSLAFPNSPKNRRPAPWFQTRFVARNRIALSGYRSQVRIFGPRPSFQTNIHSLTYQVMIMAYFGGLRLRLGALREERYPYLDREMLEFAYAVPREQIVGIGIRRFLMKRALVGVVPDEILSRKPKAPSRAEPPGLVTDCSEFRELGQHMISGLLGIIDHNRFLEILARQAFTDGMYDNLRRVLVFEGWLRGLVTKGVLKQSQSTTADQTTRSEAVRSTAPRKSSVS